MECKWLPELVPCEDIGRFKEYEQKIYQLFKRDFILSHPYFEGKQVNIRKMPIVDGFEQAFYHLTSCDYQLGQERFPDFKRCERIQWVRAFIENYNCDPSLCENCDGLKVWEEPWKGNKRVHILFEEERYIVIIEKRNSYNLLITAYYLDYNNTLEKQLKRFKRFASN